MSQAVGETWETFPELRLLALKRIQKYAVCANTHLSCDLSTSALDAAGDILRAEFYLASVASLSNLENTIVVKTHGGLSLYPAARFT